MKTKPQNNLRVSNSHSCILLLIVFLRVLFPSCSPAATLYVSESTPGEYRFIQAGLDAAVTGDEVVVRDGKYSEGNLDFRGKAITLRSEHGPDYTILNGWGDQAFNFASGEGPGTVLSGFKIKTVSVVSGGINIYLTGIRCSCSSPTITNCIVAGDAWLTPRYGRGLDILHSSPTIIECEIGGNGADCGGGIYCEYSSPTITNCKIHQNWARLGGGIGLVYSSPTITGCAIYRNHADDPNNGRGGGIYCEYSSPSIRNCTIAKNAANANVAGGSAIRCVAASSPRIINSILWDNKDPASQLSCYAAPIYITYSDIEGSYAGAGNIAQDPLFVAPAFGNFELSEGSPAIDAGINMVDPPLPATDLAGNPRITNGRVDMGAYEYLSAPAEGPGPIEELLSCVNALALPHAVASSYLAHLRKVEAFISAENITPAINQLEAFIGKLQSDIEKGNLSAARGEPIIEMAEALIGMLE